MTKISNLGVVDTLEGLNKKEFSSVEVIKEYMDYYPSTRVRGGMYKIKVGDWVDDLNCEEIIKDLTINPPLPREQNILSRNISDFAGPWQPLVRNYGLLSGKLKAKQEK